MPVNQTGQLHIVRRIETSLGSHNGAASSNIELRSKAKIKAN